MKRRWFRGLRCGLFRHRLFSMGTKRRRAMIMRRLTSRYCVRVVLNTYYYGYHEDFLFTRKMIAPMTVSYSESVYFTYDFKIENPVVILFDTSHPLCVGWSYIVLKCWAYKSWEEGPIKNCLGHSLFSMGSEREKKQPIKSFPEYAQQ